MEKIGNCIKIILEIIGKKSNGKWLVKSLKKICVY